MFFMYMRYYMLSECEVFFLVSLGRKKIVMREVIDEVIFISNVLSIESRIEYLGVV